MDERRRVFNEIQCNSLPSVPVPGIPNRVNNAQLECFHFIHLSFRVVFTSKVFLRRNIYQNNLTVWLCNVHINSNIIVK